MFKAPEFLLLDKDEMAICIASMAEDIFLKMEEGIVRLQKDVEDFENNAPIEEKAVVVAELAKIKLGIQKFFAAQSQAEEIKSAMAECCEHNIH